MANRYWVGAGGTWDQTSTTHWSATSGGASGASVPTPTDNVFFDANSGGDGTVVVQDTGGAGLPCCAALDFTGFPGYIDSTSGVLEIFGDITLSDNNHFNLFTPNIYGTSVQVNTKYNAIKDFYAGGVSINTGLSYSPTVTLTGGYLYCNGIFVFAQGTFNTNNHSVIADTFTWGTAGSVQSTTINMGSSYFTVENSITPGAGWTVAYNTSPSEVTVNAGTSTIVFAGAVDSAILTYNGATSSISSSGKTYYNLQIYQAAGFTIYGNNTFNRFDCYGIPATLTFAAGSTQTFNVLSIPGTSLGFEVTLQSTSPGTQFTLYQATGLVSVDYCIIQDNAATGGAIWYAGANSTNVSNNTGWTFSAQPPVTRYWVGGTGDWNHTDVTNWSATSGGTGGVYAPTSLDTVFIDANSGGGTVNLGDYVSVASLDCTGFTGTLASVDGNGGLDLYGNLTLGVNGTYQYFSAYLQNNATLVSNGTSNPDLQIYVYDGHVLTLGDAAAVKRITIGNSTLDTNNYDLTVNYLTSDYGSSGTFIFGGSSITARIFDVTSADIVNAGTSTINMDNAVFGDVSFSEFHGGEQTYYNLNFSTSDFSGAVYDNNTFHSITNSAQPINVYFDAGTTQTITGTFGVSGTAGNLAGTSSTAFGTQFTLVKSSGTVSCDYMYIFDSAATGGAAWYAGANSTNAENNTGWTFTAPLAQTQVRARINSSGVLFVPNFNQLDEISKSINSVDNNALYSNLFDETQSLDYNGIPVAQRKTADGKLLVSGYFDETTLQ